MRSSYDVVVLGADLAQLCAAALLAKRGFRVLVVGQDDLPPTYDAGRGLTLPRAPFTLTAAASPATRRLFGELALQPLLRRHAATMDPVLQVALPGHRLDLPFAEEDLDREIEREMPEVRRPVEDFQREVARIADVLDAVVARDLVWPPSSFLERRELLRTAAPVLDRSAPRDPFAELREGHPFRLVVQAAVRFASGMDPDHLPPLALLRLWGNSLRGAAVLEGGESALREMLLGRLRTHAGEVRERERAEAIVVKRGTATAVRLAQSGEEVGASFVVFGGDVARLLPLLGDRHTFEELFERTGEPQVRFYRYTLNLVLAAEGIPAGMARDVFLVRDARRALAGENLLHVEATALPDDGGRPRVLLCVEALLPRRGIEDVPDYLETVRERTFASLGELVPFLGRHVLLVDSPHDGRPVQDVVSGVTYAPPEPWTRGPRTMRAVHGYPVTTALGLGSLPVRTPVDRLLLCSNQVVPGLGQEGAILAAWSTARVVTRRERRKSLLRGRTWTSKLER